MDKSAIQKLQAIENFKDLVEYLGDELDWPVADLDFEDLIFQYTPEEIGLDEKSAAAVTDIKRLRPLDDDQPWGIFFLELEPKKLRVRPEMSEVLWSKMDCGSTARRPRRRPGRP